MLELLKISDVDFTNADSYTITESPNVNEFELENGHKFVEVIQNKKISISGSFESEKQNDIAHFEGVLKTIPCVAFVLDTQTGFVVERHMKYTNISKTKNFYKRGISTWGISFELEDM